MVEVIEIHYDQIQRYGWAPGSRDIHLLESAIARPMMSFGGEWLHKDIFEMGAAYAFHIAQNHPFMDGNKRTALATALILLDINGISILDPKGLLFETMLQVASGRMRKSQIADVLRKLPA